MIDGIIEGAGTRLQSQVHQAVHKALKAGTLVRPDECQWCGASEVRIEGHHPDYARPLMVLWLCAKCHRGVHRREMPPILPMDPIDPSQRFITREEFDQLVSEIV